MAIDVLKSPRLEEAFADYLQRLVLSERRYRDAESKLAIVEGEGFERQKKYGDAAAKFMEAMTLLLGPDLKIPIDGASGGGVKCSEYLRMTMDECITAMTCSNGASRCLFRSGKLPEALDWTIEVDVLHKNARYKGIPVYDWQQYHPPPPALEFHRLRLLALLTASDVFLKLGNTGAAAYVRNLGNDLISSLSEGDQYVLRQEVLPQSTWRAAMQCRHPDPSIHRNHQITQPTLQVRGSWQKLKVAVHSRISSRMAHACFIYKSRLYVCGGQRSGTSEVYKDLWCLDLARMDGWRELPSYSHPFLNCQMAVHDGKAYLFRGLSAVDYFDLERERWGRVATHFLNARGGRAEWPYKETLADYGMCVARGTLYVFGGQYTRAIGCNLFAALDVARKTWTLLSGTPDSVPLLPQYDVPGPRKQHAMWADAAGERVYVMYGMADRQAADLYREEFGSVDGFVYDDCWSWDTARKEWRRERVAGNVPCPRAEMSTCYNPNINSTIMFGGYNPALPYYESSGTCYGFHYFSDTFILDHSSPAPQWRHVITPSFPTYRAQGQLVADSATGKMFLFGGYTNTSWVPAGKHSYGDIWQLVVDVPGGLFEGVDWEDEKWCAQMGPWQICYTCKTVGSHKKCGGSCGGRVFYCTPNCQREGWPVHKKKHGCRR
ncbi:hypothetical protein V8D89_004661 [Ganoderma adspersum]